ncbi:fungal-specific transcription factor domain-containing protein [Aspergillus unguis]
MDSPKRPRNRIACKRCQRRKIRCDGNIVDSCGSCRKAGVACINDGKQEVHRSYITNKENRIKWLEAIIRERCSDIDLNSVPEGIRVPDGGVHNDGTMDEQSEERAAVPSYQSPDSVQERRELHTELSPRIVISQGQEPSQATSRLPANDEPQQAHEIGLLSLSPGGDPRYIGPSSGYSFAKRILNRAGCRSFSRASTAMVNSNQLSLELLNTPAPLPDKKQSTMELSAKYFRTVHLLYPFLHEQTHMEAIDRVYAAQESNPLETFQVYMVLAIASLNLSRQCKIHLPVEGYYGSAMKQFDYVCNYDSVASLQCLLLLMVYALYNPSCNINTWNLNYQCLASVIDLGLQRDVRASSSLHISVFDQEMRTRIFWVAYTFDRTVCTMMGRPIGIRDEACDIRFPLAIPDSDLATTRPNHTNEPLTSHMSYSIRLFRLAQLNSEIKYIMHSINRNAPAYALPAVKDILSWQKDMMVTLHNWVQTIPQHPTIGSEINTLCKAKYHETMILLLRPSPGIPNPTDEILDECFNHAIALLSEYNALYASSALLYNRLVVHSIFLGTLVMLNCIWKLPATAARVPVDELIKMFNISQNILSSIGEHWDEAARARDCIKELSGVTVRRLLKTKETAGSGNGEQAAQMYPTPQTVSSQRLERISQHQHQHQQSHRDITPGNQSGTIPEPWSFADGGMNESLDPNASEFSNIFDDFLQGDFAGWSGMSDLDGLMWDVFNTTS